MVVTETVLYSSYRVEKTHKSNLGLKQDITEEVGFRCPRCDQILNPLDHGEKGVCNRCGLKMKLWGNVLECSE